MYYTSLFLLLALISCIGGTNGDGVVDGCVPKAVENLQLSNSSLSWAISKEEVCNIDSFLIYIDFEGGTYRIGVVGTNLTVDFLDPCIIYTFNVIAISVLTLGPEETIVAPYPQQLDSYPYIESLNIKTTDEGVSLQWGVNHLRQCAKLFRLRATDEDGYVVVDSRTAGTEVIIPNLIPCMTYSFQLDIITDGFQSGDSALEFYTVPAKETSSPLFSGGYPGLTTYNITAHFDRYSKNRCPITGIIINGAKYVNETIPIEDSTLRSYTIHFEGLDPGYFYLTYIYVVNSGGISVPTVITVDTLEENN